MSGKRCKRLVKTLAISNRAWPGSGVVLSLKCSEARLGVGRDPGSP
jgi:hypothetical protein